MNIFLRELKAYRKNLLYWSLGMIFLVGSGMAKYGAYQGNGNSINDLMAQFPKSIQVIFGMDGFDLSKASGYFGVLFLYIALTATIHAVLLGTDLISKEERDKTAEFLLTKPISRQKIVSAKLWVGLFNLIVLNLITLGSSIYFVNYFNKGGSITNDIKLLLGGLFFLQLIYFLAGTAIAASNKKPKMAASIATATLLVTFAISFIINLSDKLDALKYLTPFRYFEAKDMLSKGGFEPVYVLISIVIILVLVWRTYTKFAERDLSI